MSPAANSLTYWYDSERGSKYLDVDRVAEHDGWAWVRVTGPWAAEESVREYREFNAGFTTYGHARSDLESDVGAYHPRAKAVLQAGRHQGELVLCTTATDRTDAMAFMIFAVRQGMAPSQVGPPRFEAFKSGLPTMERMTALKPGMDPKVWPLSREAGAQQRGRSDTSRSGFWGRLFGQ